MKEFILHNKWPCFSLELQIFISVIVIKLQEKCKYPLCHCLNMLSHLQYKHHLLVVQDGCLCAMLIDNTALHCKLRNSSVKCKLF